WPVLAFALIGIAEVFRTPEPDQRRVVMIALLLGAWIFHAVVNVGIEARFFAPLAAPIAVLFAAGCHRVTRMIPVNGRIARMAVAGIALVLAVHNALG